MQTTYKQAGVDIDAGNALIDRIKPFAKATRRSGSMDELGGFGALFDPKAAGFKDPLLVSSTDGVGTKLKIAQAVGKHDTIGIDLVAMCVNDLVVQGAEPLFFLDYFATGTHAVDVAAEVIKGIAEGCKQSNCALIGGETAEMPGMYAPGEYDLAGFTVGAVERDRLLPRNVGVGDVVLGLASSGVHSNGFSLVRHIMSQHNVAFDSPAPFAPGKTFAELLLVPTKLYVRSCLDALKTFPDDVHAFAHITGGGLPENLPRVLPKHLGATLSASAWNMPGIFGWLQEKGNVPIHDLRRTLNCGIGMVAVAGKDKADAIAAHFEKAGETVYQLGEITERGDEAVVFRD
ncbi:MAG: phosphoribosylformylglycinamidine cyclo-ligase [Alphaproteobacteria bacterium]|nr:phosphoribosylformylglycinamidine cyclo-ligase [Alphaproteobacteria bacterium]